jgi:hypothetical protein
MTFDAGSSNSYIKEHPFLIGPIEVSLFLSNDFPAELAPSYKFDLMKFSRQELLSYMPHW